MTKLDYMLIYLGSSVVQQLGEGGKSLFCAQETLQSSETQMKQFSTISKCIWNGNQSCL